jgi:hypothetical protein
VIGSSLVIPTTKADGVDEVVRMMMAMKMMKTVKMMKMMKAVPLSVPECVVSQNPPASSDKQHEEPGGSWDCWWPRSFGQRPEIRHTPWLLGC